jgi:septal ring factor EnvC (AmiA/AmiB activator)
MGGAGHGMGDTGHRNAEFLAVVVENAELRQQLSESQDACVELAVDAGELHAEIEVLRARLVQAERDRDAWRAEAEQVRRTG